MASVRALAEELRDRHQRIDVLANNAGALFASRKVTPDSFEQTFALNHLAPFLLTHWKVLTTLGGPFFRSPERGARSLVWLATSEEGGRLTGEYIEDEKVAQPSEAARDAELASALWERSAALVGLPADAIA
jgi:NAD(P)-dependent dehydrogenase (short-subunit alcohol dehydrogenase family)